MQKGIICFVIVGDLIEHGPAKEFFTAPKKEQTKKYISGEIS